MLLQSGQHRGTVSLVHHIWVLKHFSALRHNPFRIPMRPPATRLVLFLSLTLAWSQQPPTTSSAPAAQQPANQQPATSTPPPSPDPIETMTGRLDLERYKATVKGLTQFGDRRQG